MNYYVYKHIRLDSDTTFHVGKGSYNENGQYFESQYYRAFSKKSRNKYWHNISNKHGYRVEIVKCFKTEQDAFDYESVLISLFKKYGRCETNITLGGGGSSGVIPWNKGIPRSEKTKKKISKALTNNPNLINALKKLPPRSKEHCKNISKAKTGKPNYKIRGRSKSESHIKNLKKAKQQYEYHTPFGIFMNTRDAAKAIGVTKDTITGRCKNPKFKNYKRVLLQGIK